MITDVLLSVIVCARRQSAEVARFVPAITKFLDTNFKNYELIIVDDGSQDNTSALVKDLSRKQKNIRLLRLARHYGSGTATAAGLQHAIGDYAVVIGLNDPFESIPAMLTHCQNGYDAVFACPQKTSSGVTQTFTGWLARVSRLPINPAASNFVLMRRKAMNALLTLKDRMHNIQILAGYMGMTVDYLSLLPPKSKSRRPWRDLLHALESMLTYSRWPLWWLGAAVMGASMLAFIVAVVNWVVSGFVNEQDFVWMVGAGLLFFTNGILFVIATAVSRILAETKRQPLYYVAEEVSSRTVEIASIVRAA
jgi:dolichol-phosphate mannosyltransferase